MAGQYFCFYAHKEFTRSPCGDMECSPAGDEINCRKGQCRGKHRARCWRMPTGHKSKNAGSFSAQVFPDAVSAIPGDLLHASPTMVCRCASSRKLSCVNLVDVFRAGGTGREPPAGRHHF